MELNKNADGYFQKHVLLLCLNSLNKCFPGRSVVKNPPANAEDSGSIPGSGRPLEEGMVTHSSILAWRIPWTEEPGGLQSMRLQSLT